MKNVLLSHATSRLLNLVSQIYPNDQINAFSINNNNNQNKELLYLICLNFPSETYHLKITNAVQHTKEFHENIFLQKSLLNTNNDVIDMTNFLCNLNDKIEFLIIGHVTRNIVKQQLSNVCKLHRGIILYWSGHGKLDIYSGQLGLSFAKDAFLTKEEVVPLTTILNWCNTGGNRLLILDCCHSGAATSFGRFNDEDGHILILSSCSSNELSGGWIMDGSDSGGILTKFLCDPIGTFFKVIYGVFSELDDEAHLKLYNIYDKYADGMMRECIPDNILRIIKDCGNHVYVLFKNFLLLLKYGDLLFKKQTASSFPDLSKCIDSKLWNDFEKEIEEEIINELKYKMNKEL